MQLIFVNSLAYVALPGFLMCMKSVDAALLRECIVAAPAGKLDRFLADMAAAGNVFLKFSQLVLSTYLLFPDDACFLITDIVSVDLLGLSPTRETAGAMVRKLAHTSGVDVALGNTIFRFLPLDAVGLSHLKLVDS